MKVYFFNNAGTTLYVTGSKGSSWTTVNQVELPAHNNVGIEVAEMAEPGSGQNNWGWIYLSLGPGQSPLLQLYIAVGPVEGTYDYAIQYYDEGLNENGKSIVNSHVYLTGQDANLVLTSLQSTWMAKLRNASQPRKLHQLTIPGTHDSGTWNLSKLSWCQTYTIEEQLLNGVRYFDLRVDAGTTDLRIVHGSWPLIGNTDYYLPGVLKLFRDFLRATNETLIMQIKIDRGNPNNLNPRVIAFLNSVFAGADNVRPYVYPIRMNFSAIPTIKDLEGKLVLIRRYEDAAGDDPDSGTDVQEFASGTDYNASNWSLPNNPGGWPTATHFVWPDGGKNEPGDNISYFAPNHKFNPADRIIDYRNRHGLSYVIQDKYSIEDLTPPPGKSKADAKFAMFERYLQGASQGEALDSWFLNFSSCSETGANPVDYAAIINPLLKSYFQNLPTPAAGCGFGTILMDFAEIELLDLLIQSNS